MTPLLAKLRHRSVFKTYSSNLADITVAKGARIIDIGAGDLVVRKIYNDSDTHYAAFDPMIAEIKVGTGKSGDQLISDYFCPEYVQGELFSHVFLLTVVDEINDKKAFLSSIKQIMRDETILIVAVRNLSFPFRLRKSVEQKVDSELVDDLTYSEWVSLFNQFEIISIKKFNRPIFSLSIPVIFKQAVIRLLDWFLPVKRAYMIRFVMKKKKV